MAIWTSYRILTYNIWPWHHTLYSDTDFHSLQQWCLRQSCNMHISINTAYQCPDIQPEKSTHTACGASWYPVRNIDGCLTPSQWTLLPHPLRIWVQDPLKCSSRCLIAVVPQFPPQREHNQTLALLFTIPGIKKKAGCFSCGLWFWWFFFFFPQIPHWLKASFRPLAWPRSFASLWNQPPSCHYVQVFCTSVDLSLCILVSGLVVGGWLHCLLTKSSAPAAER